MNNDFKTPGLNNSEIYMLTQNGFYNYVALIFTDLKKLRFIKYRLEIVHIKKLRYLRVLII